MTKYITVATKKGGTGKTMITWQLAGALAEDDPNGRVLLIDCDPQANLSRNAKINVYQPEYPSIMDIFNDPDIRLENVAYRSVVVNPANIDVVPAIKGLERMEMELVARAGREYLLKNWLEENEDGLSEYGYVLMDTSPSLGVLNQNAFIAADSILLVTDLAVNALDGIHQFMAFWNKSARDLRIENKAKALVINNADMRLRRMLGEVEEYIDDNAELSALFVEPVVPMRAAFKGSERAKEPITAWRPRSEESEIIRGLMRSLREKGAL